MNLLNPHVFEDGFTQSELSLFSICPMKWNLRYNHLLRKRGAFGWATIVGTIFHKAMELYYTKIGINDLNIATLQFPSEFIPSAKDYELQQYWNLILPIMVRAYKGYYKDDYLKWDVQSAEREIEIQYAGFKIRGKIDLTVLTGDGSYIVDHKTTSRLNIQTVAGWDFRFQFMFYLWLCWKAGEHHAGLIVNAVKKPELRQKKTETLEDFVERVFIDMAMEPEKYFYRETYLITKDALEHFETEVLDHKLKRLKFVQSIDSTRSGLDSLQDAVVQIVAQSIIEDKNTDECQRYGTPCEFIDICRYGIDKMKSLYEVRNRKHEELEIGINE